MNAEFAEGHKNRTGFSQKSIYLAYPIAFAGTLGESIGDSIDTVWSSQTPVADGSETTRERRTPVHCLSSPGLCRSAVQAAACEILPEGNHFSWGITPPLNAWLSHRSVAPRS